MILPLQPIRHTVSKKMYIAIIIITHENIAHSKQIPFLLGCSMTSMTQRFAGQPGLPG